MRPEDLPIREPLFHKALRKLAGAMLPDLANELLFNEMVEKVVTKLSLLIFIGIRELQRNRVNMGDA